MNAKSLTLSLALTLALTGCIEKRDGGGTTDGGNTYDGGTDDGGMTDDGGTSDDGGTDGGTNDGGTDLDEDGRTDGIGSDEVVPHGDYIDIAKRRLPTTNLDELYYVGRGLGTDDDYCSTQVIVAELDAEFVRVTVPAYVAENGYLFGNVRRMPDGECVDSGEQSYWGSLDDLYGQDPAICPNPEDEYRKGILVNFTADGEVINPMDCTAAIGDNDPGNDDEDDDDTAGTSDGGSDDGGSSSDGGGTSDGGSGDGGSSDGGSSSDGTCTIRVSVDGDGSIEGDSSYYAELYILALNASGGVVDSTYWPTGDWSSQSSDELEEALSFSDGGADYGEFTFSSSISSVKLNGAVWNGSSFLRWLVGSYGDSSGASFEVELSCDGDAYTELDCAPSGNDMLCD